MNSLDDETVQNQAQETFLNDNLASFIASEDSPCPGPSAGAAQPSARDERNIQDRVNSDLADFCRQPSPLPSPPVSNDDTLELDADFRTPAARLRVRHRDHRARFRQSVEQPSAPDFFDLPARSPHPSDFSTPRDHPWRRMHGVEPARPVGLERALWGRPTVHRRAVSDLSEAKIRKLRLGR